MSEKIESNQNEKFDAINDFRGHELVPHGVGSFESISRYYDVIKALPWADGWTSKEIVELADLAVAMAGRMSDDEHSTHGYFALKNNKEAEEWLQKIIDLPLP